MIKPITPDEAEIEKLNDIPEGVIEVFNDLIKEGLNSKGNRVVINQNDAVQLICENLNVSREEVFKKKWLDIEPLYRNAGWNVEYDKPGYNETYEPNYTFTRKK
jgi:hypothetical protein